jgi:hypothetical protein
MTPNPVIACDFEFLTHQFKFYLKWGGHCSRRNRGAQHTLTSVWVKPSAHLVLYEYGVPGTRNRFLSLDFMDTNTLTARE